MVGAQRRSRFGRGLLLGLTVVLTATACVQGSASQTALVPPTTPPTLSEPVLPPTDTLSTSTTAAAAVCRTAPSGARHGGAEEQGPCPVGPGDGSFLFTAVAADGDLDVTLSIEDVLRPDGASAVVDFSLNDNPAEVSVLITAPGGLQPGDYVVVLDTPVATNTSAFVRPVPSGAQSIDLTVWDATRAGRHATDAAGTERLIRLRGDDVFHGTGLAIGAVDVRRAPGSTVRSSANLRLESTGTERPLRELCRAMGKAVGPAPTLRLVLVDRIIDRGTKDAEIFGAAAAVPGAAMVPGASTSCAAVAVGGEGGLVSQTGTLWHEAAHLLGLFHTTEEDGTEWDPIPDTPQCTTAEDTDDDGYVFQDECAALDGDNLLFHDGDGVRLSAGQVAVLKAHPLFR